MYDLITSRVLYVSESVSTSNVVLDAQPSFSVLLQMGTPCVTHSPFVSNWKCTLVISAPVVQMGPNEPPSSPVQLNPTTSNLASEYDNFVQCAHGCYHHPSCFRDQEHVVSSYDGDHRAPPLRGRCRHACIHSAACGFHHSTLPAITNTVPGDLTVNEPSKMTTDPWPPLSQTSYFVESDLCCATSSCSSPVEGPKSPSNISGAVDSTNCHTDQYEATETGLSTA